MKIRFIAEFKADFPDDSEWGEDDEAIVLGGRGVADQIAVILSGLGYDVTSPEHSPPYGWRFDICSDRAPGMIQVTDLGDEFVLLVSDRTPFLKRLFSRKVSIDPELAERLHAALSRDDRFHNICWRDQNRRQFVPTAEPRFPQQKAPE